MSREALGSASDALYGVAVLVYVLALLASAYAWSARRAAAPSSAVASSQVPAAAVGAGRAPVMAGARRGSGPVPAPASRTTASGGGGALAAVRAAWAARAGLALTVLAAAVHAGSVVTRGLAAGHAPWATMYEFTSAAALAAVVTWLVLHRRGEARELGVFVLLPVVVALCVGASLYRPVGQLQPALDSYWLQIHVSLAVVATGVFTVGGVAAALYLVRTRWEERAAAGTSSPRGLGAHLPPAARLDAVAYRANAFGVPLWTLAVLLGAVWAREAWTRAWGWDPKETWAFISWVLYAAYLHARTTAGWRGRRAAALGLVAFATILFNYFAVNLVFPGLHSYSGL